MLADETSFYIAFSVFPGIGPVRFRLLREAFGSAEAAWNASKSQLQKVGLPLPLIDRFIAFRKLHSFTSYQTSLTREHIHVLTDEDSLYPKRLVSISDAPFVLYIKGEGDLSLLSQERLIGVVGTRKVSPYGSQVTEKITGDLVSRGFGIVSGLALGVDGIAHNTALQHNGKTIAVLGCGVDIIAPSSHRQIYMDIMKSGGLIISEMPLGHRPDKGLFPARNRIISGLSQGVLVTEGAKTSGSLITARYAAEQGREVFAIPGQITSQLSEGTNSLIQQGATLVQNVEDILGVLGVSTHHQTTHTFLLSNFLPIEQQILSVLLNNSLDIDNLVIETGMALTMVNQTITSLELKSVIRRDDLGKYYIVK